MNAWDHLPNAPHIDWVIASVNGHCEEWVAAWESTRTTSRHAAWNSARQVARDSAWTAADDSIAARNSARHAALDSIIALVAYDHSAKYLDMTHEQMLVWRYISNDPASILLLPAVKARELIEQKQSIINYEH